MSAVNIRIPKSFVKGFFISAAAYLVAAIGLTLLDTLVPISPTAKILEFLAINRNNPVVYTTDLYRKLSVPAQYEDAFVLTPLAMLIGGLVWGWYCKRLGFALKRIVIAALAAGCVLGIATELSAWSLVIIDMRIAHQISAETDPSNWTAQSMGLAAGVVAAPTAAFAAGAAISAALSKVSGRVETTRKVSPKAKPAST